MLVLTRKTGQSIKIGEDVEIVVVEVRGDQVRLGIRAPRSVSIVRGEIVEAIQRENQAAALSDTDILASLAEFTERSDTPGAIHMSINAEASNVTDASPGEKAQGD